MKNEHALEVSEIFRELKTQSTGLLEEEAQKRLLEIGLNKLASRKKSSAIQLFLDQFKSFLVLILLVAALLSLGTSFIPGHEENFMDAVLIFIILFANAFFGFVQDYKAEKSIEALKKMATPVTRVLRNGLECTISVEEIVPGDIVLLKEGDRIPGDIRLLEVINFTVDESALTGESMPVSKTMGVLLEQVSLAERKNMAYMNTNVTRGKARGIVIATGMQTEMGKIASMLLQEDDQKSPFDIELDHLGKKIGLGVILIAVVIAITEIIVHQGSVLTVLLSAMALAVAAIPEGLPAVVTLALALGVMRMVQQHALVRKLNTVESLGSVNVICTDKTGTLTENRMTVTYLYANSKMVNVTGVGYELQGKFIEGIANSENSSDGKIVPVTELEQLLTAAALCNDARLDLSTNETNPEIKFQGDPTEIAVLVPAYKLGWNVTQLRKEHARVSEVSFSSERKMMTTVHEWNATKRVYSKGAIECILGKCEYYWNKGEIEKLTPKLKQDFLEKNNEMASKALRVLAFAFKENPKSLNENDVEKDLIFLGLMGMKDPPRAGVKQAIEDCRNAGIRVVMITGDNPLTAKAVGSELGFTGQVIIGNELDGMNERELHASVTQVSMYARTSPEHKVRILKALQAHGNIVAMTGDGVNDAPALKQSDVGIAMGIRGTDVAKETSDLILLDDNFVTIRNAIEQGRGIFENIRKFVAYLLAANSAEVLVFFIASLLGLGLPLTVVQLLWINLLTDGMPALALGVDPIPIGIMKKSPRKKSEKIIDSSMMRFIAIVSASATLVLLALFVIYDPVQNLVKAQTIVFTGFVVFEMIKIFLVRARYHTHELSNQWLLGAIAGSFALQLIVLYTPLSGFFKLSEITAMDWVNIAIAGIIFTLLASILFKLEKFLKHVSYSL